MQFWIWTYSPANGGSFGPDIPIGDSQPATTFLGAGDFDGDGDSDILWTDDVGQRKLHTVHNRIFQSTTTISILPGFGNIVGTGNFEGGLDSDLLMSGGSFFSFHFMQNGAPSDHSPGSWAQSAGWSHQGTGTFNSDTLSDLLWRNTNGSLELWLVDDDGDLGDVEKRAIEVTPLPDSSWTIRGVADMNRDGRSDIIWQHTSGRIRTWLMDGEAQIGVRDAGELATGTVVELVDFNGDGHIDFVIAEPDGDIVIWLMTNGVKDSTLPTLPPRPTPTNWLIAGAGRF